jgi:predicted ATP-grasp superfamily ATP-dependent carboligase
MNSIKLACERRDEKQRIIRMYNYRNKTQVKKNGPWVCIIGGSFSQVPYIRAANNLGYNTLVFDRDFNAPGADYATRFIAISTHDNDKILGTIAKISENIYLAGCLTSSAHHKALSTTAAVVEEFDLIGSNTDAANLTNNKKLMKECLKSNNIMTPAYCCIDYTVDAGKFLASYSTAIMKPSSGGTGSAGIRIIANGQLHLQDFNQTQVESLDNHVILEEYFPGQEYSIDGFVNKGKVNILSVSLKYTNGPAGNFTIDGFATGNKIDDKVFTSMYDIADKVVIALKLDNTFFSIDAIIGEKEIAVVDVGLLLDAKIDRLIFFAGLDIYTLRIRLATNSLDEKNEQYLVNDHGYALKFFYPDSSGYLYYNDKNIEMLRRKHELCFERQRLSGDYVSKPASLSDTIGWVIAKGEDYSQAWSLVSSINSDSIFSVR